jgi:hypothetical protein
MSPRKKIESLIRYVSPFGSPAWMTREQAHKYLEQDDKHWALMEEAGNLSERERRIGPPHIEFPR